MLERMKTNSKAWYWRHPFMKHQETKLQDPWYDPEIGLLLVQCSACTPYVRLGFLQVLQFLEPLKHGLVDWAIWMSVWIMSCEGLAFHAECNPSLHWIFQDRLQIFSDHDQNMVIDDEWINETMCDLLASVERPNSWCFIIPTGTDKS